MTCTVETEVFFQISKYALNCCSFFVQLLKTLASSCRHGVFANVLIYLYFEDLLAATFCEGTASTRFRSCEFQCSVDRIKAVIHVGFSFAANRVKVLVKSLWRLRMVNEIDNRKGIQRVNQFINGVRVIAFVGHDVLCL
ncbi:hypothetical protein D3C86_1311300 [compost metagenome]